MKPLLTALAVLCTAVLGADKPAASGKALVSQCFKVRKLLKTDSTHYWADWSNTCPYTIEAVYVMVGFLDGGRQEMGTGVWPMYFVRPGAHRVTRFSAPVADFETVHVHQITTDSVLALKPDPGVSEPVKAAPTKVGDNSVGKIAVKPPEAGPEPPKVASNRTKY
jgi:hypothetical protein